MAGVCSRILRACTVIHLQRPVKISKHHPCLRHIPHLPLHLLGYIAQVIELAQHPRPVVEPFLILYPLKTSSFLGSGKCTRVTYPNEEYIASKIQKGSPGILPGLFVCLFLLVEGKDRYSNLIFQFWIDISISPCTWISRNFTQRSPLNFCCFYFPFSDTQVTYQQG